MCCINMPLRHQRKGMKVLSLFDGISCARVALERAGFNVDNYFASEVDKYAIQIAQKNYPDILQVGDVKNIKGGHKETSTVFLSQEIDLLIGGSPCQDLSIAKKDRKGLNGERSGLFWEYVRILKEVKPHYFILENVASMPKEAKETITKELGVEPVMINASLVSAQNRKRLFWVGRRVGNEYVQVEIPQPEDRGILLKDILEESVDDKYAYNQKNKVNTNQGNRVYATDGKGVTLKALGGGGGAKTGLYLVGLIDGKNSQGKRVYSPEGKSTTLGAGTTAGGESGRRTGLYAVSQRGRYLVDGKRKDVLGAKTEQRIEIGGSEKAHTITSVFKDSMVMEDTIIRKLTPIECERLQGLPDNYTEGVSNTQRYKMLGNAFNCDVVAHILKFIK